MTKYLLSLICLLLSSATLFAAEPLKVSSEIKQANVYLKGAVLKNKATANIPAGRSSIIFTGLSYNIQRESIRIKSEGCQIFSVTMKKNFMDLKLLDEQLKEQKEELIKLSEKREDGNDLLAVYANEKGMILSNMSIGGEQNGVDPEKLRLAADFFRQRLTDILSKEQAIKADMGKMDKRILELATQINESAAKNVYPTSEIEININAEKSVNAQFDIEYYITEAGWFPAYDFRVNSLTTPMQIDYVAHIYQNSGLDWKNVEVSVSSADPGNNGGMPIPKTWYVSQNSYGLQYDVQKPKTEQNKVSGRVTDNMGNPVPYANISIANSSVGGSTDYEGRFNIALPAGARNMIISAVGYDKQDRRIEGYDMSITLQSSARQLEEVTIASNMATAAVSEQINIRSSRSESKVVLDAAKVRESSGAVLESNVNTTTSAVSFEYTLKEKMNVPSDGRPYTAQIMKREILAEYKHFAAPKITRDAYLNIFIPEWEKLNLLEGEVNLYFGNSYTGKSVVSLRDLKDSLEFSMGKDPNVKIQRTLAFQKTTGGGILPNKTSGYRWNSEIRNTGTMPVRLTVTEPFPVSTEKEIKVELDKELSGASIDKEKGLLTWEITLQPGEQKKLDFGFSVTYPKALNMRFE
jgi:hypothetical protein